MRDEVLYREALAAGLDRDDIVVRRRLRQKMEFLTDELAGAAQPTEKELADFLAANAAAFRAEPRFTFSQEMLGGRLPMLEARYENVPQREVERVFGREFARRLTKLPPGRWTGPVASGYGAHRVRLEKLVPGGMPSLEEVRPLVEREWRNARRNASARGAVREAAQPVQSEVARQMTRFLAILLFSLICSRARAATRFPADRRAGARPL